VSALSSFYNALDYPLRQFFRWQRGRPRLRDESKNALFAHLEPASRAPAEAEAARLRLDYGLDYLYAHSEALLYRENLYYLRLLERALEAAEAGDAEPAWSLPAAAVTAADIGPSHWFYVEALYNLLQWRAPTPAGRPRAVTLTAYETDAYRVYADLHSRCDYALAHMQGLAGARYLPRRFEPDPGAFDFITMLFPFIFLRDHREWGLPDSMFAPARLLRDAWASLREGGLLVIANQGEAEHREQLALLAGVGAAPRAAYRHDSVLFDYDVPRFVIVARRA
jgi:hypothetical protein